MAAVKNSTVFRWGMAGGAGVAVVLISLSAIWRVRDILVLALVALFIAVSLDPAVRWLVRHGIKRPFAVTLIMLIALTVVTAVIWLVIPPLVQEATQLTRKFPDYLASLQERSKTYRELSARYGLEQHLTDIAKDLPARISTSAVDFFRRFLGVLASSLLVLVLSIYFMADLPRIRRAIPKLAAERYRERTRAVVNVVVDKVGSYMIGGIAVSSIAATVAFVGLSLLKVPGPLPLALLVFLFAFIPLIGATLASVICIAVAGIANGWQSALFTAILFIVYQQIENYIIAPRVMQKTVNLPAVAVLLAGLLGGTMLGLVGALMAIPISAAIKAVMTEVRHPSHDDEEGEPPAPEPPPKAEPQVA